MSFDTCKDVWVFIECFQGQPKSVGLELLGQGRKLADGLKQKLCAVVIAKDVDEAVKEAGEYGADKIYVVKGDEYENYSLPFTVAPTRIVLGSYFSQSFKNTFP